jgi:hypothetical protein
VSKDEILSTVWHGQFVAESGMTRCVAEIRQALGDDARHPDIVQTITKRGYRLVAPVTFIEAPACPAPTAQRLTAEAALPVPELTPAGPPAPAGSAQSPPESRKEAGAATPRPRWRLLQPVGRQGLPVVGVAALLALAWVGAGSSRAPVSSERDTVVLADVTNTTGDSAFDRRLRFALASHLEEVLSLRVLPEARVRAALTLMGRSPDQPVTGAVALELCRRARASVLLEGSITRLGSHYAVGLAAVACSSGESIAHQLVEADSKGGVLSALETAAARLRRTLSASRAFMDNFAGPRTGQPADRPVIAPLLRIGTRNSA